MGASLLALANLYSSTKVLNFYDNIGSILLPP